mmetsp:Transcript_55027/g.160601  ORF Transcript_55027/g.160601 Transcript_55027/m.160601 type:complete len:529 (-) Transcript_55027:41-1627(-)
MWLGNYADWLKDAALPAQGGPPPLGLTSAAFGVQPECGGCEFLRRRAKELPEAKEEEAVFHLITDSRDSWATKAAELSAALLGADALSCLGPADAAVGLVRGRELLGFATFGPHQDVGEAPELRVHALGVDASHQGRRVGRLLLGYVQYRCFGRDVPYMSVACSSPYFEEGPGFRGHRPYFLDALSFGEQDGVLYFDVTFELKRVKYWTSLFRPFNIALEARRGPSIMSESMRTWLASIMPNSSLPKSEEGSDWEDWAGSYLADHGNKTQQLHYAVSCGDCASIKTLCQQGADPQASLTPLEHVEPLATAALCGRLDAVVALIECLADPIRPCWKTYSTPLLIARLHKHWDIVQCLEEYARRVDHDHFDLDHDSAMEGWRRLQQRFLEMHRAPIRKELGKDVVLSHVTPSFQVQDRFLSRLRKAGCVHVPAYHGTPAKNINSIATLGFRLPDSGPAERNSLYDIKGIYFTKLGFGRMSKVYCSTNEMLVCAVVEDGEQRVKNVTEAAILVEDEALVAPLFVASNLKWS